MATWVVGGITFADPGGMSTASGLGTGRYWNKTVRAGAPVYERRVFSYPGVDGLAVKAFGFRGRPVRGSVVYVAASVSALRAMIEDDRQALANTTFSTQLPDGIALNHCQLEALDDGEIAVLRPGVVAMETELAVLQLRGD